MIAASALKCASYEGRSGVAAAVRLVSSMRTRNSGTIGALSPYCSDHTHLPLSTTRAQAFSAASAVRDFADPQGAARKHRPIYIAATRQHVGKTSVSLALMKGLQRRVPKVGFLKPVGQHSVRIAELDGSVVTVDKDTALIVQHFGLTRHQTLQDASPVLIPPGYTKDYVDGKITLDTQRASIGKSFQRVASFADIVLCEGTGHCAVGSIVDASNAAVASWLGARMVLVANGGLGNSVDELELNKALCDKHGVEIAGVIINKVLPEKYEQTKYYLEKALHDRWGIPLLGCVPDRAFLGCPALADLERLFPGAMLVSGLDHRLRHYTVQDLNLVATSLEVFLRNLRTDPSRTLYVCHASRNDILLGFLMESQQRPDWEAALVVTGCHDYPVSDQVLQIITSMPSAPPVLLASPPTRQVMHDIHHFTPKLNFEDGHRVEAAAAHYEPYIDFDLLLSRVGTTSTSSSKSTSKAGLAVAVP